MKLKYKADPQETIGCVGGLVVDAVWSGICFVCGHVLGLFFRGTAGLPDSLIGTAIVVFVVGLVTWPLLVEWWWQRVTEPRRHERFNLWHKDGEWRQIRHLPKDPVEGDWVRLDNWRGTRVFATFKDKVWTISFDNLLGEEARSAWFFFFWSS